MATSRSTSRGRAATAHAPLVGCGTRLELVDSAVHLQCQKQDDARDRARFHFQPLLDLLVVCMNVSEKWTFTNVVGTAQLLCTVVSAEVGTFAPLLDGAGNSVKGQLVAKFLSQRLGMDLFASKPAK